MTYKIAAGLMILYGLACLVGGIIGYVKAGSTASLATGVPAGILLLVCAGAILLGWFAAPTALGGAIVVALLVGGFFASKVVSTGAEPRPLALIGGAVIVILACAVALFQGGSSAP